MYGVCGISFDPKLKVILFIVKDEARNYFPYIPFTLFPQTGSKASQIFFQDTHILLSYEELDSPAVSALQRVIAQVKQRWSVIAWVNKNLLSGAPPCFGRQVKSLASTNPPWARVVGYGLVAAVS
jgi:hypothetical protein